MSVVLYFDCFSGISGDMAIGALLDAGLPLDDLTRALGSLTLDGVHVHARKVVRTGVAATKFSVHGHAHEPVHAGGAGHAHHDDDHPPHEHEHHGRQRHTDAGHSHDHGHTHDHGQSDDHSHSHDHGHRTLREIVALIDRSALSAAARARAAAMFQRLAEAEASIHQMPVEQVHLHEVGAIDSIVDIVGIAFAMEWAGADRVVCSPLNVGGGMVQSAHGLFPVPAPATLKLLAGVPVYSGRVQKELVTPTGALIATTYASAFGPMPAMEVERVGYGAGDRDDPQTPNVLRVVIGHETDARGDAPGDRVTVIECEIDDMNPQIFGVVMDRLYAAGALEVFYVPVQMKKNRPGTLLTVIARPEQRGQLADIVFAETTTIGLRHYEVDRECLDRRIVTVTTPVGDVRFKVASRHGRVVNATPEFDDCARLAAAHNLSVKDVQILALRAYQS